MHCRKFYSSISYSSISHGILCADLFFFLAILLNRNLNLMCIIKPLPFGFWKVICGFFFHFMSLLLSFFLFIVFNCLMTSKVKKIIVPIHSSRCVFELCFLGSKFVYCHYVLAPLVSVSLPKLYVWFHFFRHSCLNEYKILYEMYCQT